MGGELHALATNHVSICTLQLMSYVEEPKHNSFPPKPHKIYFQKKKKKKTHKR